MRSVVEALQARVSQLERRLADNQQPAASTPTPLAPPKQEQPALPQPTAAPSTVAALPGDTTVNVLIDGYYGYNFNSPIGRANLLRAYDVSSNSFSLNQAALVMESAPDLSKGKRWGARLDLQWGQATQTLQGNAANEPRPEIYRDLFQVYGTYIAPIGNGLTIDFGKWASSLGIEGNYGKDQINYSRSYWYDFLPFYHMGLRMNYKVNGWLTANYWLTSGTQQTEDFNSYKDQLAGVVLQPRKSVTWTVNYYRGQEHPDVIFYPPGDAPSPNLPQLQGVPFQPIPDAPTGRLHILDTYASWNVSPALTLAGEADWVWQRLYRSSAPERANGGAGYLRYQVKPRFAVAVRAEYLGDPNGLFSGAGQALKETTFTTEYKFGDGFLMRGEYRRDFSNQPEFFTSTLGVLKKEQNTATVGLIWWFGQKQGAW